MYEENWVVFISSVMFGIIFGKTIGQLELRVGTAIDRKRILMKAAENHMDLDLFVVVSAEHHVVEVAVAIIWLSISYAHSPLT